MIRIGVLGAGHLGKIHIKLLNGLTDQFDLVGFYDPIQENAEAFSKQFGIPAFQDIESLLNEVDAIDIVTPTLNHFDCAKLALEKDKHVFVEKPITNTLKEAETLKQILSTKNLSFQVGHVERFNPAFIASKAYLNEPKFIETHRLAPFNPRGTDVSVVLDLMIHDLDVILSVIDSPVKNIHASGVNVISNNPDIANVRLEFENGCVANLTASRMSMKTMRKSRFFQNNGYISVDFGEHKSEVFQLTDDLSSDGFEIELNDSKKQFNYIQPEVIKSNAIEEELKAFCLSIHDGSRPVVNLEDGYKALRLAYQILEKI